MALALSNPGCCHPFHCPGSLLYTPQRASNYMVAQPGGKPNCAHSGRKRHGGPLSRHFHTRRPQGSYRRPKSLDIYLHATSVSSNPLATSIVSNTVNHIATNDFKNFMPTIINTLGFSQEVTIVLTCPPYLIAGAFSVAWAISSRHCNERT